MTFWQVFFLLVCLAVLLVTFVVLTLEVMGIVWDYIKSR